MPHELPNDLENKDILRKYQNWVEMEPNAQSTKDKAFAITVKNHTEVVIQLFYS